MSQMICAICGRYGIRWEGSLSLFSHTRCPHCGGVNCQVPEEPDEQEGDAPEEKPS